MERAVKVSPDGFMVAVRSDVEDENAWNAWGVMHAFHGGHWSSTSELEGWSDVTAVDPPLVPQNPETPPETP